MVSKFTDNDYLLKEIKAGNTEAFEFLFKSYYPRLLGYAMRFVQGEEEARDIVQECFISFWERREYLASISITSLLFTIVRNSCLNYLKHLSIVEKYQLDYLAHKKGEEHLYHADFLLHTDDKLLFDELQTQVNAVIGNLPERCREVFLLSRFEGMKNREIAEKLNISTTAVEKHISKAILRFSKHFKDNFPDMYILILAWLIVR